jgi:hypothetical protein
LKREALFINGVYEDVLKEILRIQEHLPGHIMYLQPYSASAIRHLHDSPPSSEDAVELYLSTTTDLGHISYRAEIVGIDDKTTLTVEKRNALNRVIWCLQPNETGLYTDANGEKCVNLLHIRRLQHVTPAVPVTQLVKTADGTPIAGVRTTAGGWSYVRPDPRC